MEVQDLGTIQYKVEADTTGLDKAVSATDAMAQNMTEAGTAVDNLGKKITDTSSKSESASRSIISSFDKVSASLKREVDLYGDTSRAAAIAYDIKKGALGALTGAQKELLISLAATADEMDKTAIAAAQLAQSELAIANASKITQTAINQQFASVENSLLREIELYGDVSRSAKLAFEMEAGGLKNLSAAQKQTITAMSSQLDALEKSSGKAGNALGGMRGIAQSAGYQLQDVAVQAQMGTSAFTILGQQGSQFASAFGPTGAVVGAVLAVGAALGGVLFKSLMDTSKAMSEVGDNAKEMAKNIRDLTDAEREHLKLANTDAVNKQIKEANSLSEVIKKQTEAIKKLNDENGKSKVSVSNTPGGGAVVYTEIINNTKELQLQQEKLNATTIKFDAINKQIESDRDIEGAKKTIQALRDQTDLVGLHGDALWKQKGIQAGLTDENLKAYMLEAKRFDSATTAQHIKGLNDESLALDLKNAEIHKNISLTAQLSDQIAKSKASDQGGTSGQQDEIVAIEKLNTAKREKNEADQKAQSLYESQDKAAKDRIMSMEREVVLFGDTSKAAAIEYDIKSGLIKVNGGLESQQAQQILNYAKILEMMETMNTLAKSQREVDISAMGENGKLASTQLEYDLKHGIVKLNNDIDGQEASILVTNKKRVEANERIFNIDEMIKKQREDMVLNAGDGSKAAQLEYEIRNDILKVEGGITSEQGQQLVANQKALDMQTKLKSASQITADAMERIDSVFADAWVNIMDGSDNAFKSIGKAFKQTLAEMAHEAITKPILLNIQQSMTGGASSAGQGAMAGIGSAGIYAAVAVAVIAGVSMFNKQQDEKFVKMTSQYKQANQGLSNILGEGNKKSEAINKSIDGLKDVNGNVLDVNYSMLNSLLAIQSSIGAVAAGFAKTLTGAGDYKAMGISQGIYTAPKSAMATVSLGSSVNYSNITKGTGGGELDQAVGGFIDSISNKINSALYNEKTKVIDSGISIIGNTLANIMSGATIDAFNYADVQTKKKIIGITSSIKVKRSQEDLSSTFEAQITDVFSGAGKALKTASEAFGINFDSYLSQLKVKTQDLSLKGLEGDALTKEIESFFSSTLDSWASVLLTGTSILKDYQRVGESAFETFVRLSAETKTVMGYVDNLGLNLHATGISAVNAVQGISTAIGGFDVLTQSLATYSDKFLSDADKFKQLQQQAGDYLGALGVSLPKSREEFKGMVQAIDLTTDAGQKQFSALIKVSGAVDDYITQLEKQRKAIADSTFSGLTRAVDAQKKILSAQMAVMNDSLTASQAVYSALSSTLNGMVIDSKQTEAMTRKQAQSQLLDALNAGGTPDLDSLTHALSTVSKPSENLYKTFQEYATDFYNTADIIKKLQDAAGTQVSNDEKSLNELQKQSDDLDNMLTWAKMQVDILNGIDVSVISVADALASFGAALGVDVPNSQSLAALAAASTSTAGGTPAQQAANAQAQKQVDQINAQTKSFQEYVKSSQYAIANSTDKIFKVLDKFDNIGMPPVRT